MALNLTIIGGDETALLISDTGSSIVAQQAEAARDAAQVAATSTDADVIATAADRVATGQDRVATGQDRVQTGLDVIAADADAAATAADRVQTGLDRVQTGLDRDSATTQASTATTQASTATTQAGIATTKAGEAATSASTASTQAGIATTQAGIATTEATTATTEATTATTGATTATTQAGIATGAASTATTQATTATTQAGIATTQAATATTQASAASASATTATTQASASAASAAASASNSMTAQAQASLAAGFAASAASVVQQDLSGIDAQALHRSPNAVTAMFLYDTSKDSDGGAWTEKCQHTSWWNEPLMGKWLGAWTSEAAARCSLGTLGPELITNGTFDTSLTGWVAGGGATLTLDNRRLRVTSTVNTGGAATQTVNVVAGKVYRVTVGYLQAFTSAGVPDSAARGRVSAGWGTAQANTIGTNSTENIRTSGGVLYFVAATSGTASISVQTANDGAFAPAGHYVVADDISVREVTTFAAVSGDYLQGSVDGKFYRLWKNLVQNGGDLTQSTWGKAALTASVSAVAPPSGVLSGVTSLVADTTNAVHKATATVTYTGLSGSVSFYVRANGGRYFGVRMIGTSPQAWAFFDLQNPNTVTLSASSTPNFSTATLTDLGDGWYRVTIAQAFLGGSGTNALTIYVLGSQPVSPWTINEATLAYTGDGVSGIFVAGVQAEFSLVPTAYEAKGAEGSISEVFRGNKRDFPRLAGIVAEARSLNIYDLTEPGRPLWMRFSSTGTNTSISQLASGAGADISSVAALNGALGIGSNSGLALVNFASDGIIGGRFGGQNWTLRDPLIASRHSQVSPPISGGGYVIASNAVNAVAMTVLPDAPVDPVTGLRVPTIAAATTAGISVIQHNGTVRNSSLTSSFDSLALTPSLLSAGRADGTWYSAATPGSLGASFALTQRTSTQAPGFGSGNTGKLVAPGRSRLLRRSTTAARAQLAQAHESDLARSLVATVGDTFNTGWMTGDIRRCFMSNIVAGAASNPSYGDTAFDTGITAWTSVATVSGPNLELSWDGANKRMNFLRTATAWESTMLAIPTVPGDRYRMGIQGASGVFARLGTIPVGNNIWDWQQSVQSFIAPSNMVYMTLDMIASASAGTSGYIDAFVIEHLEPDRSYKAASAAITGTLTRAQLASGTSLVGYSGWSAANYLREPYSADLDFGTGEWTASAWVNVPASVPAAAVIFERAAASGASMRLGVGGTGLLTAEAFDGTTTRTVTTTASYNTATWLKARVSYTTDGTLALVVNGREVATTRGTPLLTLNNTSAVLTIGNSFALDAPFPGSIALLKLGATVPTPEQAVFMVEQEKQLFRSDALSVLPDSGNIVDMAYDDATDRWVAVSATNESYWTGLVRNSVTPVPAGSFSRIVAGSGVELAARSTPNPGVDVTIPAYGLREELVKRGEAAARLSRELAIYDFVGGFTASTTNTSTAITSVAGLSYPTRLIGARISGAGIPTNTTIVGVSGTTIYLSAAATATATGVSISFLDFALPVGMEAKAVMSAGALRQEGATKDFTRLFDGFVETIRFAVAPGATAWVQIQATRGAVQ